MRYDVDRPPLCEGNVEFVPTRAYGIITEWRSEACFEHGVS